MSTLVYHHDVDSKIPNLALMRLARYQRERGCEVRLVRGARPRSLLDLPGEHYGSSIFEFAKGLRERVEQSWGPVKWGGTGVRVDSNLSEIDPSVDWDKVKPDYSDYPDFTASIGFNFRGCTLRCKFCVVPEKEGKPSAATPIRDIYRGDPWPRHLHLLDNDFFGGPTWKDSVAEIREGKFKIAFSQGINIRQITEEAAVALSTIDYRGNDFGKKVLYTAWDNLGDEKRFKQGVAILSAAGIPAYRLRVYMLIGYALRETFDEVLYRFDEMRALGCEPYPMLYNPTRTDDYGRALRKFQRYVIRRIYRKVPWSEYDPSYRSSQTARKISLPVLVEQPQAVDAVELREEKCVIDIVSKRADPTPSKVYDTYWRFAAERQAMYFRRLRGEMVRIAECGDCRGGSLSQVDGRGICPHKVQVLALTADPILRQHRFTNVYRAADRVSQYLIRNVVGAGDQSAKEIIFRVLLFKIFNKISTWELLQNVIKMGAFQIYSNDLGGRLGGTSSPIERIFDEAKAAGRTLYSAAYVMPSPGNAKVKHKAHLDVLFRVVNSWHEIACAKTLQGLYEVLLKVPSFGPFLAYQFAVDLNYSPVVDFDEDSFVMPGPGALDGLKKCFADPGGYSEADLIRWTCDRQEAEFARLGLKFENLFGRRLKLIDAQNCFCEVDKVARVRHPDVEGRSGRLRIKQLYRPDPAPLPKPFFPPKWGINEKVMNEID